MHRLATVCSLLAILSGSAHAQHMLRVGPGRDFATIQTAVNAAVSGDYILVDGGIYPEFVNFPSQVTGLTLIGDYSPRLLGFDTHNADNLTIQGFVIDADGPDTTGVILGSNHVTITDITCDFLHGPCIAAPEPVSYITVRRVQALGVTGFQINGSFWDVSDSTTWNQAPEPIGLQWDIRGHHIHLRGNFATNQGSPQAVCYKLSGHHITMESNGCTGAFQAVILTSGHHLEIIDTMVVVFSPGPAIIIRPGVSSATITRSRLTSYGLPFAHCAIRVQVGAKNIKIIGNVFDRLDQGYCGVGLPQATIAANVLRGLTAPDPGPADVVEPAL